jgi:hypothetical protein
MEMLNRAIEAAAPSSESMPNSLTSFHSAQALAERFHATYERLAPSFGYETRPGTRAFDAQSANGRLMVAVCQELLASSEPLPAQSPPEFDRDTDGELLIDWAPGTGRMLTLSLRADGRLAYAFHWDGEKAHGTVQMPAADTQGDARKRINIHLLWHEANKEWGEAIGGPAEYEIFADKLFTAMSSALNEQGKQP